MRHTRPPTVTFAALNAPPQPVNRRVQLPLHRSLREPERFGDLPQLQSLMMPHHEDEPLPVRQPRYLGFEHFAELARVGAILGPGTLLGCVQHAEFRLLAKRRAAAGDWRRR